MSEKQIREILRDVCADLEQHSRRVVRAGVRKVVLPSVLGAGLALGGCDLGGESDYGAPVPDGYYKVDAGKGDGVVEDVGKGDAIVGKDAAVYSAPDAIYAAPMDGAAADTKKEADNGAQPDYMAPDGGK